MSTVEKLRTDRQLEAMHKTPESEYWVATKILNSDAGTHNDPEKPSNRIVTQLQALNSQMTAESGLKLLSRYHEGRCVCELVDCKH